VTPIGVSRSAAASATDGFRTQPNPLALLKGSNEGSRSPRAGDSMSTFHFPRWTNHFKLLIPAGAVGGVLYAVTFVWLGFSPKTIAVGYQPEQPIPFSHALHAGELGFDCRYCHNTVDVAGHAAVPPTETCMRCHENLRSDSKKLAALRQSWETGKPIKWERVHDLPDYAYFNHAAHVNRGVSCVSCHGRIDQMEVVKQVEPLSMGWCLECHRNPNPHLRPLDQITNLGWTPPEGDDSWQEQLVYGFEPDEAAKAEEGYDPYSHVNPQETCSTCHR